MALLDAADSALADVSIDERDWAPPGVDLEFLKQGEAQLKKVKKDRIAAYLTLRDYMTVAQAQSIYVAISTNRKPRQRERDTDRDVSQSGQGPR